MLSADSVSVWLLHTTMCTTVVLAIGLVLITIWRRPSERLRVVQMSMFCSIVGPILIATCSRYLPHFELTTLRRPLAVGADRSRNVSLEVHRDVSAVAPKPAAGSIETGPVSAKWNEPRRLLPHEGIVPSPPRATSVDARVNGQERLGLSYGAWLATTWGAMVVASLGWWFWGWLLRYRLASHSFDADEGARSILYDLVGEDVSRVRLRVSRQIDAPLAWGVFFPTILLPQQFFDSYTEIERRWAIAHEWCHVRSRDTLTQWFVLVAQLTCWCQPIYWYLRRRARLWQDLVADGFAAQQCGAVDEYASFLLRLATTRAQHSAAPSLGISSRRSQLAERIRSLLGPEPLGRLDCSRPITIAAGVVMVASLFLGMAIRFEVAAQESAALSPPQQVNLGERKFECLVVSEETRLPIVDAEVLVSHPVRHSVRTDTDGHAVVSGLGAGVHLIWVRSTDYESTHFHVDLSRAGQTNSRVVALRPGGEVRGRVVDDRGDPIVGAGVDFDEELGGHHYAGTYRTDADGKFVSRGLPLNVPLRLVVHSDRYMGASESVALSHELRRLETHLVMKRRSPGPTVVGIVHDTLQKPIANARIIHFGRSPEPIRDVTTNVQGQYRIEDLIRGFADYELGVSAPGFAPQKVIVVPSVEAEVTELNVTLQPGHRLVGRVVDEERRPIPGAIVHVRSHQFLHGQFVSATTDDQGQLDLDSLPADAEYHISHAAFGFIAQGPLPMDTAQPVDITLPAPGEISVQVVDAESDQPISEYFITAAGVRSPNLSTHVDFPSELSSGHDVVAIDGRYVIRPVTFGGALDITVSSAMHERVVTKNVIATRDGSQNVIVIKLPQRRLAEVANVSVQLVNDLNQPISNASLQLIVVARNPESSLQASLNWTLVDSGQMKDQPAVEQVLPGVTNADGRWEFSEVKMGRSMRLLYSGSGIARGDFNLLPRDDPGDSAPIKIRIPRAATIRGTIDRMIFPEAESIVLLAGDFGRVPGVKLSAGQTDFEMEGQPIGSYKLVLYAKSTQVNTPIVGVASYKLFPVGSQTITLRAGETTEIQIDESWRE